MQKQLARGEIRSKDAVIMMSAVRNFRADNMGKAGETVAPSVHHARAEVCPCLCFPLDTQFQSCPFPQVLSMMMGANIPLQTMDNPKFRAEIERSRGVPMTTASHLGEYVPICHRLQKTLVMKDMELNEEDDLRKCRWFAFIWDGTTRVGELFAGIIRYWKGRRALSLALFCLSVLSLCFLILYLSFAFTLLLLCAVCQPFVCWQTGKCASG